MPPPPSLSEIATALRRKFRPRLFTLPRAAYGRGQLVTDSLSGVTVALIALPLALALAVASIPAGVATPIPVPAIGIFTAIIGGFLVSLLGGSRVQISGPTAAFVTVILLIIDRHGYDGLLLATLMAGAMLVLMGLSGLGTLIKFIPYPVTSGFTTGIAIAIIVGQVPGFIGLPAEAVPPREFSEKLPWLFEHLPALNAATLCVAALAAALLYWWPRYAARWRAAWLPAPIVAIVLCAALVALLNGQAHAGVATIGSLFGPDALPRELPALALPAISLARIGELMGPAITIALLGAIESLLSAVVADGLANDRHDSNTELVAQGIANLVCPFFGGIPVTGAIARTSANVKAGARTPIAGLVHAVTLLVIVLFCAPLVRYVPIGAIAAVLIFVALRMGNWRELLRLGKMPRSDALVLLTTCSLTVLFDLVVAVEVGILLAGALFIKRMADTTEISRVTARDELETPEQVAHGKDIPDGVVVYRIFGPFFFGAAEKMENAILSAAPPPRVLILRMQLVPAMDATALNALESIVERMHAAGGQVILSGPHRQPLDMMRKAGFVGKLGRPNICPHFDAALARAQSLSGSTNLAAPAP